jgi:hypothetical protein
MATRNGNEKKSTVVSVGDANDAEVGFTERVLLSLVVDISILHESVERVKVQVFALAREHGVKTEI